MAVSRCFQGWKRKCL